MTAAATPMAVGSRETRGAMDAVRAMKGTDGARVTAAGVGKQEGITSTRGSPSGGPVSFDSRLQRVGLPAQALHLLVEVAPLQPQTRGRSRHAAPRAQQRRLDLLPLELPHRLA